MKSRITLSPGQTVALRDVSKEALAAAMRAHLPSFSARNDPFLVVVDDAYRFVQLWANAPDGFQVEYGENGQPFEHPDGDRTLEETVALFERFADGVWPPFDGGVPLDMGEPLAAPAPNPTAVRTFNTQTLLFLLLLLFLILAYFFG
ncbi:MAG: hypothetical protein IAE99_11580 [Rhodothermales bacterium]|nr:hypothetical protein [Rhodothermales bacterium]